MWRQSAILNRHSLRRKRKVDWGQGLLLKIRIFLPNIIILGLLSKMDLLSRHLRKRWRDSIKYRSTSIYTSKGNGRKLRKWWSRCCKMSSRKRTYSRSNRRSVLKASNLLKSDSAKWDKEKRLRATSKSSCANPRYLQRNSKRTPQKRKD